MIREPQCKPGDRVQCKPDAHYFVIQDSKLTLRGSKLPRRKWWHAIFKIPDPIFTVKEIRITETRNALSGIFATIEDNNGKCYDLPECFLIPIDTPAHKE